MKCPCEDEMYLCETPCNRESCAYQQGKNDGRADAIREYKNKLIIDVCARAQNCYKDTFNEREQEIFNFATKTFLDAIDYFEEQLKSQKM